MMNPSLPDDIAANVAILNAAAEQIAPLIPLAIVAAMAAGFLVFAIGAGLWHCVRGCYIATCKPTRRRRRHYR